MLENIYLYDVVGILGAVIILVFFLLNQADKIKNSSIYYDTGNFVGSAFLVYFAMETNSLPFIILNTVWGLFSLKDMVVYFKNRK